MANINFIYYREFQGTTRTLLQTEHSYSEEDIDQYAKNYYYSDAPHRRPVSEFDAFQEAIFAQKLFPRLVPGEYHVFIVTTEQLPSLQHDLVKTGLSQYITHTIPPAVNSNYPEQGERLYMFILKLPKDFKNV